MAAVAAQDRRPAASVVSSRTAYGWTLAERAEERNSVKPEQDDLTSERKN